MTPVRGAARKADSVVPPAIFTVAAPLAAGPAGAAARARRSTRAVRPRDARGGRSGIAVGPAGGRDVVGAAGRAADGDIVRARGRVADARAAGVDAHDIVGVAAGG